MQHKCSFGCGQNALYQLKNGKWCCSSSCNSCPEMRRKNGQGYRPPRMTHEEFKTKRRVYAAKYRERSAVYRTWLHEYIKTPRARSTRYRIRHEWYHKRGGKEHVRNYAKARHMERRLRIHSITHEYFVNKLREQHNACAICNVPFDLSKLQFVVVDHDHTTGKVRGLLCRWCNWGLGHFKDNGAALKNAAEYLKQYKSEKGGA